MNKNQRQLVKRINEAYRKLSTLNNITWTAYRDELFNLNLKDEKKHRSSFGGHINRFESSASDCARLFVVRHIAEALTNPNQYKIKDILHIRESAIKAQALVENYADRIIEAWKTEDIKELATLDYIELIDYEEFLKLEATRKEWEAV
jgi:hypothetical protein